MGHRPSANDEVQLLRQATREAHEAAQQLKDVIREAKLLAVTLVEQFEEIHHREIRQLSNYFTEESNRHAASLNRDVERARDMIFQEIMSGELVLDRSSMTARIRFGGTAFADHEPPPFPEQAQKRITE